MFDKYSFKELENAHNLAKQITINPWKPIQNSIKKRKKKQPKIIKNIQKSTKNTPRKASGHCRGSRWGKMAQKEVGYRILGSPGTPWGTPKSPKSQKNEVQKSIKIQNDLKEPLKAISGCQKLHKAFKNESKMTFESETTDF